MKHKRYLYTQQTCPREAATKHTHTYTHTYPDISEEKFPGFDANKTKERGRRKVYLDQVPAIHKLTDQSGQ